METEITEKAKKIVASSVAGIGVLGSLLGLGVKKFANAQETETITQELQSNSEQLLAIADELGGLQGQKAMEVGEYIGKIATKMAEGETPTEEELQKAQKDLQELGGQSDNQSTSSGDASNDKDEDMESGNKGNSGSNSDNQPSATDKTSESKSANQEKGDDKQEKEKSSAEKPNQQSASANNQNKSANQATNKPTSEEAQKLQNDAQSITELLEGLTAGLTELGGMFEEADKDTEEETAELTEVNEQVQELINDITSKFAENETEIDVTQQDTLNKLAEWDESLANLADNLETTEIESINEQDKVLKELQSDRQSLNDNSEKIDNLVKQIIEGKIDIKVENEGDDEDSESINLPDNLTSLNEKMETSFTPFQDLVSKINSDLTSFRTNLDNQFNSLIESLDKNNQELDVSIKEWVEDLQEQQENKIEISLTNVVENLNNSFEDFETENQDISNKFKEDCESYIIKIQDLLKEKIEDNLTEKSEDFEDKLIKMLNQAEENNQLVSNQETILSKISRLADDLIDTKETVAKIKENLDNVVV